MAVSVKDQVLLTCPSSAASHLLDHTLSHILLSHPQSISLWSATEHQNESIYTWPCACPSSVGVVMNEKTVFAASGETQSKVSRYERHQVEASATWNCSEQVLALYLINQSIVILYISGKLEALNLELTQSLFTMKSDSYQVKWNCLLNENRLLLVKSVAEKELLIQIIHFESNSASVQWTRTVTLQSAALSFTCDKSRHCLWTVHKHGLIQCHDFYVNEKAGNNVLQLNSKRLKNVQLACLLDGFLAIWNSEILTIWHLKPQPLLHFSQSLKGKVLSVNENSLISLNENEIVLNVVSSQAPKLAQCLGLAVLTAPYLLSTTLHCQEADTNESELIQEIHAWSSSSPASFHSKMQEFIESTKFLSQPVTQLLCRRLFSHPSYFNASLLEECIELGSFSTQLNPFWMERILQWSSSQVAVRLALKLANQIRESDLMRLILVLIQEPNQAEIHSNLIQILSLPFCEPFMRPFFKNLSYSQLDSLMQHLMDYLSESNEIKVSHVSWLSLCMERCMNRLSSNQESLGLMRRVCEWLEDNLALAEMGAHGLKALDNVPKSAESLNHRYSIETVIM